MKIPIIESIFRAEDFSIILKPAVDLNNLEYFFQFFIISKDRLNFEISLDGACLLSIELEECLDRLEEYNYFSVKTLAYEYFYEKDLKMLNSEKNEERQELEIIVEALENSKISFMYRKRIYELFLSLYELMEFSNRLKEVLDNFLLLIPFLKIKNLYFIPVLGEVYIISYENEKNLKFSNSDVEKIINFRPEKISFNRETLSLSKGVIEIIGSEEKVFLYSDLLEEEIYLSLTEFSLFVWFLKRKKFSIEAAALFRR